MSRPWMPLYIADYLADTTHLRAAQSGAYLHLIMHYWQKGSLPDNDGQLSAIARMTSAEWKRDRAILAAFFQQPGWHHKRIDEELAEAEEKYQKRAGAGRKGGNAKAEGKQQPSNASSIATANDQALLYQPQPQLQRDDRIGSASARGASMLTDGSKVRASAFWRALGFNNPIDIPHEFAGVDMRAVEWERAGWTVEMIAAEAKNTGPAKPLTYHEKVFATAHAKLQAPLPKVEIREAETVKVTHGSNKSRPNVVDVARRYAEHFESQSGDGFEGNSGAVLRLPQR